MKLDIGQTIFLQISITKAIKQIKQKSTKSTRSQATIERDVLGSLAALDQYKNRVESKLFDPDTILEVIRELKFMKQDRAMYSAFCTWLWSALPDNDSQLFPD